jgi:hypothetical protein
MMLNLSSQTYRQTIAPSWFRNPNKVHCAVQTAVAECLEVSKKVHKVQCWQEGTSVHKMHALHTHFNFSDDLAPKHLISLPIAQHITQMISC